MKNWFADKETTEKEKEKAGIFVRKAAGKLLIAAAFFLFSFLEQPLCGRAESGNGKDRPSETALWKEAVPEEILKYSPPENSRGKLVRPPDVMEQRGRKYQLVFWDIAEEAGERNSCYKEAPVIYEKTGAKARIPKEADILLEGTDTPVKMRLLSTEFFNERWEPDFEFALTFHKWGADVYQLGAGQIRISTGQETEELLKYDTEILALMGLGEESYRITDIRWKEEAYEDENGVLCRDAVGTGERLVYDCRAVYGGEILEESRPLYRTKAVYRLEREAAETAGKDEGDGAEQPDSGERDIWKKVIKAVTVTFAVTVGVGTAVLLLILFRMIWRAVRRIREKYSGKD